MSAERPLFIPVILGTPRQGRMSEHAARFVLGQVRKREGVKDARFSAAMNRADGLVIVTPEYNHGYPGMLKHALDTNLKEYVHKAVGVCGVSAGGFGGTRVIENLLPVLRELGLVTIFWDLNFSSVGKVFDRSGALLDESYVKRADKFLGELVWMAKVLRHGRENVPL